MLIKSCGVPKSSTLLQGRRTVFLEANEVETLHWATLLTPASGKKIWFKSHLKNLSTEAKFIPLFCCLLPFFVFKQPLIWDKFFTFGSPGVLEIACCGEAICWKPVQGSAQGSRYEWDRWAVQLSGWWVLSDCGGCSAVETGKWAELSCSSGYMWRIKHPPDYLDFTKRGVQSEARAGISGRGESGSETDDLCLNFSKTVRCKWCFLLCKYYGGRVSKH